MGTSTEELSNDIALTRAELSQDVDALQDKVSPSAIIERRKSAVRGRLTAARDRVMGGVVGGGQDAAQGVSSATSSAGGAIGDRVEGSPLAAGLVAFGAGLVIAGLIPATKAEAQGAQRLKEAAQEHGQPVMDQARSAAQEVGDQLKGKASEAVDEVRSSAQESADRVKEEATTGSPGDAADDSSYRSPGTTA
jgi:gas vesicle protein